MKLINEKMKIKNILTKIVQHENIKYYFIICLMGICLSVPLMRGYMIGHDSESHIARVMSTVISLKQHQILPMIASNYVNGLGYSWNMFYPPLTNYLAILLKIFTSTYVQALNLLVGLSIIFSGIFMYHLTEKITKSKKVGLLSAILYITVPYRIADIYVRYALGEIVSFVFIPLVFNGLYSIFEENGKRHFLLTIGAVGLLLTHNITTLLIIFVCAIFIIFHIDQLKDVKKIRTLLFNALWIILIVSCFYGPLLESKNATNYTVFNEFMSENKLGEAQISLWEILIGKLYFSENIAYNHRISVAIGCIITLLTLMTPFVYCKIDKHKRRIYILAVFIGIFCIFASSKCHGSICQTYLNFYNFLIDYSLLLVFY